VSKLVALFVVFSIICFLTIDYLIQLPQLGESRVGSEASTTSEAAVSGRFSTGVENFSYGKPVPLGIYLNPGHTWAKPESSGSLRIGIDSLPAHAVGVPAEI